MKNSLNILVISLFCMFSLNAQTKDNDGYADPVHGAHHDETIYGKISEIIDSNRDRFPESGIYKLKINDIQYQIQLLIEDKLENHMVLYGQYADWNENYMYLRIGHIIWRLVSSDTWYQVGCGNKIKKVIFPKNNKCVPCVDSSKRVAELEKENAELKNQISALKNELEFLNYEVEKLRCMLDFQKKLSAIFIGYNNRLDKYKWAENELYKLSQHPCAPNAIIKIKRRNSGKSFIAGALVGGGITLLVKSLFNTKEGKKYSFNHEQEGPKFGHEQDRYQSGNSNFNHEQNSRVTTSQKRVVDTYKYNSSPHKGRRIRMK